MMPRKSLCPHSNAFKTPARHTHQHRQGQEVGQSDAMPLERLVHLIAGLLFWQIHM